MLLSEGRAREETYSSFITLSNNSTLRAPPLNVLAAVLSAGTSLLSSWVIKSGESSLP